MSAHFMLRRWSKLEKDFKTKNGRYDISKIPDIYDCIKYDVQHNGSLKLENTMELYRLSKALADIVIPQEYGITKAEKLEIAKGYCTPLVRKIRSDLQRTQDDDTVNKLHPVYSRGVLSPERHVRTRLYFTSESHVHSLLSILRYGALCDDSKDEQWKRAMDYLNVVNELNYMTQIVIMLYEDPNKDLSSEERFHVELHFSPGAKGCEEDKNLPSGYGYRPASRENEGRRSLKTDDDEPHTSKRDEVDRVVMLFKPLVSEPIHIHRKSPLPRSRKITANEEETPLSVSMATRSSPGMRRKISLNTYTPTKILPTPPAALKSSKASSKAAAGGPSQAMAPHTSSRKKSINSKTEGHEPKKSTGKKR